MARATDDPFTTLPVRQSDVERLKRIRPYDSMSWRELINELADAYKSEQ